MRINVTVAHIVNECQGLTQKESKRWRHDQVAKIIGSCVRSKIFSAKRNGASINLRMYLSQKHLRLCGIFQYKHIRNWKTTNRKYWWKIK